MTRTAMPMAQEAELPLTPAELDVCHSFVNGEHTHTHSLSHLTTLLTMLSWVPPSCFILTTIIIFAHILGSTQAIS